MATALITNIGEAFTGDIGEPTADISALLVEDARIAALDPPAATRADMVIDAKGGAVMPGIVDGHVHPVFGEWTPTQNTIGWIRNYLHGGTTTMVSAGELHVPGLDYNNLNADLMTNLALVTRATTGRTRWSGVKLHAGTVLMVPGMTEAHFDQLTDAGSILAKFLFYPLVEQNKEEAQRYVTWCHDRGLRVKVHTGGVSRSGANAVCGFETLSWLQPDVAAHVSGGPIPMSDGDLDALVDETDFALELCSSGSYRSFIRVVDRLAEAGRLDRLTLGTDTPGGTGVLARGMLRNILFLASVCGLSAGQAIAVGTGNTALAHGLDVGFLREGAPADIVLAGRIDGSAGSTVGEAIEHGDLPGISTVMIDGQVLVKGRSEQTPPPAARADLTVEDWNAFGGCPFCG
ncbi:MAG: amidohydrolase family protein [Alphaproteobacteria bacterium]|nr:amidohydrolase family protein [Alphaproteobacteria bacterium]